MLPQRIASILLEIGAVGVSPQAPVTFKSGILSPVYMDNRRLPFHPALWREVIEGLQSLASALPCEVVAGVEAAGIPHSAALGLTMQCPSVFVRKAAKEHGQKKRVEGGDVAGKRVVLVEDLITTGGSSLNAIEALRQEGAIVHDCLAIISYGLAEAQTQFADANITLHTLTDFPAVWELLKPTLPAETIASVERWHTNPHDWSPT